MKKFRLALSFLTILALSLALVACGEADKGSGKDLPEDIKINVCATFRLEEGREAALGATVSGTQEALSFSSSDESVVTVSADGNITAISPGEAVITVSVAGISKTCAVTVTAVVETTELPGIDIDLSDSSTFVLELPAEVVPLKVEADGTASSGNYSAEGNRLTLTKDGIIELLHEKKYGDIEILVRSESANYGIPAHVLTKIVRTKEDVTEMMRLATAGSRTEGDNATRSGIKPAQPDYYDEADGYFALAENIDMEGDTIRFCHKDGEFKGIIDGRGHAIFNIGALEYRLLDDTTARLTNGNSGIFGQISGTVRNIAFVNVICGRDDASPDEEACIRNIALAYRLLPSAVLENIYLTFVQTTDTAGMDDGSGAIGRIEERATLSNVVIEAMNKPNNMRSRGDNDCEVINTKGKTSNVFNVFGLCCEYGANLPVGDIYRGYGQMQKDEPDLSDFDQKYWDTTGGIPTFRSVMADMEAEKDIKIMGLTAEETGPGQADISKSKLANLPRGENTLYLNTTSKYMMMYRIEGGEIPTGATAFKYNSSLRGMENVATGTKFTVIAYNAKYPDEEKGRITFTVTD